MDYPLESKRRSARIWFMGNFIYFNTKHIEAETELLPLSRRNFQIIFLKESVWISIEISLKSVPKGTIDNFPSLVQIMNWRRPGDKPLSEAMMISLLTHLCVTRSQWIRLKTSNYIHMQLWDIITLAPI